MADVVKCPVCGESNAADQEFCQRCQSRLQPLTGPLKGADAPLRPGQLPTKKVTAELEPILPQWLREARDKARTSGDEDSIQEMQQPQSFAPPSVSEPDLLAGLRSQARSDDDEDETPDWLANITGASPKTKKADLGRSEARRVELGDRNDFARDTAPLKQSTPTWAPNPEPVQAESETDDLKDWFRSSTGFEANEPDPSADNVASNFSNEAAAPTADAPDWLSRMAADAPQESQAGDAAPLGRSAAGAFDSGTASGEAVPSWLQGIDSTPSSAEGVSGDEWLKEHQPKPSEPPLKKNTTPLWLKELNSGGAPAPDAQTPLWLEEEAPVVFPPPLTPAASTNAESEPPELGDIPSWLRAAAPQSSIYSEAPANDAPAQLSSWETTFKSPEPAEVTPFESDASDAQQAAAFTSDSIADANANALFTEMPDWLSNASQPTPALTASPIPAGSVDSLMPGELPSWVQAMRPVDPGPRASSTSAVSDATLETRGALSGLQGVLPAVPGYRPSSKPKVQSIRLQASQEQQSHAALLEQILAAEAEPVPITSFAPLRSSRALRWFVSLVLLVALGGVSALKTQIFSLPVGVPAEFRGALQVAQNISNNAPLLVTVDYHPARAAEMEAAAAPMFDQMMVLHHPRLTFIATNETGAILAEHFMSGPLAERGYQYGAQYLDLGYLPGGVMGIRAFVANPVAAMPFDIMLNSAWSSAPLEGVSSLQQFAAVIVMTDNADSARAWIEQSSAARQASSFPLVVITSAQAAPLLQPYYNSGQLSGIINGLYGGALFEENNAGRPGTARNDWDAYSLGLLLAMSLMLGGGLWSAALGLRDRAAARGAR